MFSSRGHGAPVVRCRGVEESSRGRIVRGEDRHSLMVRTELEHSRSGLAQLASASDTTQDAVLESVRVVGQVTREQ